MISFNSIKSVVLSRGANAVLQYIVIILYGTFLSIEKFGELSLLMIFVGISFACIDFGTQNTVVTNTLKKIDKQRLQFLNLILALIITILFQIFSFPLNNFLNTSDEFLYCFMLMPCFLIIHSLSIVPYARLLKAQKLNYLGWVDFIGVFSMFLSVIIFLLNNFSLYTFILSLLVQAFVRLFILKIYLGRLISFRLDFLSLKIYKKLLIQFSSNLVVYVSFRIDQLVIVRFINLEVLGQYSFLKQLLSYPINLITAIFSQTVVPYFSRFRTNIKFVHTTLIQSITFISSLILLYYLILFLMPPPFKDISELWNFSSVLSVCIMLMCISRIFLDCLIITAVATGHVLEQLKRNFLLLIINLLLVFLIIIYSIEIYLVSLSAMILIFVFSIYIKVFRKSNNKATIS